MAAELRGGKKVNAAIQREKESFLSVFTPFLWKVANQTMMKLAALCDLTYYVGNTAHKKLSKSEARKKDTKISPLLFSFFFHTATT